VSATVVTLGEAMLRLSPPAAGRLDEARSLDVNVAGSELNVAVALASLGVRTSWVSALPDSPLGRRVLHDARAAGVDTSFVQTREGRMGTFFVEFGTAPRPTSVWYDREQTAFRSVQGIPPQALAGARLAVVSGVTAALGATGRRLAGEFAEAARAAGAALCVDVNHRALLWTAAEARDALTPMLAQAATVVCSHADAHTVFGADAQSAEDALDDLRELAPGTETIVLTLGAEGALAAERGGDAVHQPAFAAAVRDRIGAGDAFVAGFLWGLLDDAGLAGSLARAAALAALKQTVHGDFARFTADEVLAVIAEPTKALIR
jgi:2-dehydro-3-deoxygluconokinase